MPAGTYTIGSPEADADRDDNEQQHRVTMTQPFVIAVTEVTQEQYQRVTGENPSKENERVRSRPP